MDPHIGNVLINLLVLVLLVLVNAFFAMSEIAILQSNQNRTRKLAEEGNKKAKTLLRITAEPTDFLSTIQVGVTLSGFLASAVAADKFAGMLADSLTFIPISPSVIEGISLVLVTLLLSYFTLVFGELVPKRLAMKSPDKLALGVTGIIYGLYVVLKPVIRLLSVSTNAVSRLFGIKPGDDGENVTEEDILLMVEEGEEQGALHRRETQMIQNIFDLDDKPVSEVMTHRVDMAMLSAADTVETALRLSREEGYSRIPVYEEDFDNITGILYIKDLIGIPEKEQQNPVKSYLRRAIYVPEGKLCSKLLLEFQETRIHMAIVVDEYGGTAGLVTLEDLLEIIVGNIEDESDQIEAPEMEKVGDEYYFDGDVSLEDVEEELDIQIEDDYDCDTLGGYIMSVLGKIPSEPNQDVVSLGGRYTAVVEQIADRRIERVHVVPVAVEQAAGQAN